MNQKIKGKDKTLNGKINELSFSSIIFWSSYTTI